MAAAGLRRQAALAERTADLEGLEAVPGDMVSRVLRQRPVDPPTIILFRSPDAGSARGRRGRRAALDQQVETALESTSDAAALTRLAKALVPQQGRIDAARTVQGRIKAQCRGYHAHPAGKRQRRYLRRAERGRRPDRTGARPPGAATPPQPRRLLLVWWQAAADRTPRRRCGRPSRRRAAGCAPLSPDAPARTPRGPTFSSRTKAPTGAESFLVIEAPHLFPVPCARRYDLDANRTASMVQCPPDQRSPAKRAFTSTTKRWMTILCIWS